MQARSILLRLKHLAVSKQLTAASNSLLISSRVASQSQADTFGAVAIALCFGSAGVLLADAVVSDDQLQAYEHRSKVATNPTTLFNNLASSSLAGEACMTRSDFVRSLLFSHFKFSDADAIVRVSHLPTIQKLGDHGGRLTFAEFMLVDLLLLVPDEHFELAFDLFDVDGNGMLSLEELRTAVRQLGRRQHVDTTAMTQSLQELSRSKLISTLSSTPLQQLSAMSSSELGALQIHYKDLLQFLKDLKQDLLRAEFEYYAAGEPALNALAAQQFLLSHASPSDIRKRLSANIAPRAGQAALTFEDFSKVHTIFARYGSTISDTLELITHSSQSVSAKQLQRVVRAASGHTLPEAFLSLLFVTFPSKADSSHIDYRAFWKTYSKKFAAMRFEAPVEKGWKAFRRCVSEDTE